MSSSDVRLIDAANSTTTALNATLTFLGAWTDVSEYAMLTCLVSTDVPGTLTITFSSDGVNVDRTKEYNEVIGGVHTLVHIARFCKVSYTVGTTNSTYLRIQTIHHKYKSKELTTTTSESVSNDTDCQVVRQINDVKLDAARVINSSFVSTHVAGASEAITTTLSDVWVVGGLYPFPTTALAVRIKAGGNAADTAAGAGARSVIVEGLDANWDPVSYTIATAGASVSDPTSGTMIRINSAYVASTGTYGLSNTGIIDIETTGGTTLARIGATLGKTQLSMYSVRAGYTGFITSLQAAVYNSTKACDVFFVCRSDADTVAAPFGATILLSKFSELTGSSVIQYGSYIRVAEKSDIWLQATKLAAGTASIIANYDVSITKN